MATKKIFLLNNLTKYVSIHTFLVNWVSLNIDVIFVYRIGDEMKRNTI